LLRAPVCAPVRAEQFGESEDRPEQTQVKAECKSAQAPAMAALLGHDVADELMPVAALELIECNR
jgi:hypothetical protein